MLQGRGELLLKANPRAVGYATHMQAMPRAAPLFAGPRPTAAPDVPQHQKGQRWGSRGRLMQGGMVHPFLRHFKRQITDYDDRWHRFFLIISSRSYLNETVPPEPGFFKCSLGMALPCPPWPLSKAALPSALKRPQRGAEGNGGPKGGRTQGKQQDDRCCCPWRAGTWFSRCFPELPQRHCMCQRLIHALLDTWTHTQLQPRLETPPQTSKDWD